MIKHSVFEIEFTFIFNKIIIVLIKYLFLWVIDSICDDSVIMWLIMWMPELLYKLSDISFVFSLRLCCSWCGYVIAHHSIDVFSSFLISLSQFVEFLSMSQCHFHCQIMSLSCYHHCRCHHHRNHLYCQNDCCCYHHCFCCGNDIGR